MTIEQQNKRTFTLIIIAFSILIMGCMSSCTKECGFIDFQSQELKMGENTQEYSGMIFNEDGEIDVIIGDTLHVHKVHNWIYQDGEYWLLWGNHVAMNIRFEFNGCDWMVLKTDHFEWYFEKI